jgi:hypothetical protein
MKKLSELADALAALYYCEPKGNKPDFAFYGYLGLDLYLQNFYVISGIFFDFSDFRDWQSWKGVKHEIHRLSLSQNHKFSCFFVYEVFGLRNLIKILIKLYPSIE